MINMCKLFHIMAFVAMLVTMTSSQQLTTIGEPVWKVVTSVQHPDSQIVVVQYQEKYGTLRTINCTSLFENAECFKFNSNVETGRLFKANLVSLFYYVKSVKDVPRCDTIPQRDTISQQFTIPQNDK